MISFPSLGMHLFQIPPVSFPFAISRALSSDRERRDSRLGFFRPSLGASATESGSIFLGNSGSGKK